MNSETDQLPAPDKPQVKPTIKEKKKLRDWHGCDYSFRLIRSGKEFLVLKMHQFRAVSLHFFFFSFFFSCDKNVKGPEGDKTGSNGRLAQIQQQRQFCQNWLFTCF